MVKTNNQDVKARNEAVQIKVTIKKLRCKQRLKGDKSLIVLSYQEKLYSLKIDQKKCYSYTQNETINAYYSKTYDKLFLNI